MARISGIIGLTGKFGDNVFYTTKHGRHVRKAVRPGTKKDEQALKNQYKRNSFLNKLAATINGMIGEHCPTLKPGDFYSRTLSLFRKEPLDNRYLLLKKLVGMQVHPKNSVDISPGLSFKTVKRELVIEVDIISHPVYKKSQVKTYYLVPVLMTFPKKDPADMNIQLSEWVNTRDKPPTFEFSFPLQKGTAHWLLGLQVIAGEKERPIEAQWAEAMKLIAAGTFEKKDLAIEAARNEEKEEETMMRLKKVVDVVRVKAKR